MMKYIWPLPLLLVGGAAQAKGFTSADLISAAQSGLASATTQKSAAMLDASEALRLGYALDAARTQVDRPAGEKALLASALGTGDANGDLRAKWFMAGAIARVGPNASTILYNPLARGWLTLGWAEVGGGWEVVSARVSAAAPSDWTSRQGSYLANFVADYASTSVTTGTAPAGLAGANAQQWMTGVALWMRDPLRRKAADEARDAISAGHTAKFAGGAIDIMPARARATYWPVAGFARQAGGGSLIYGSALYPHILIAADFDDAARPGLRRLTLINLANAESVK